MDETVASSRPTRASTASSRPTNVLMPMITSPAPANAARKFVGAASIVSPTRIPPAGRRAPPRPPSTGITRTASTRARDACPASAATVPRLKVRTAGAETGRQRSAAAIYRNRRRGARQICEDRQAALAARRFQVLEAATEPAAAQGDDGVGAPSPRTTRRSAASKPRRCASSARLRTACSRASKSWPPAAAAPPRASISASISPAISAASVSSKPPFFRASAAAVPRPLPARVTAPSVSFAPCASPAAR